MEISEELELSPLEEDSRHVDVTDDKVDLWLLLLTLSLSDTADDVEVDEPKLLLNDVFSVDQGRPLVDINSEEDETE